MSQCDLSADYVHWIYFVFGDCVYSTQEAASVLLGYLSIFCWLNAQIPQVIENYRLGSVESLSINFLSIWFAGDAANLIGCILTGQLPFQRYLGTYFVCIDVCLLCQWIFYNARDKRRRRHRLPANKQQHHSSDPLSKVFQHPSVRTPLLIEGQPAPGKTIDDDLAPYSASSSPGKWYTLTDTDTNKNKTALMALLLFGMRLPAAAITSTTATSSDDAWASVLTVADSTLIIGRVFAWTCTTLYLLSRIPQIVKNYRRQSIDGLSPALFAFAASGNLTYTSSILLNPNMSREALLEAVPYLIGSAGTLTFDFIIFCQFLYYWNRNSKRHHHRHHPDNSNLNVV